MKFGWNILRDLAILIIGVGLVVGLVRLDQGLTQAETEVVNNRIVDCRMLLSHSIPLLPDGPCTNPTVLAVLCETPPQPEECSR